MPNTSTPFTRSLLLALSLALAANAAELTFSDQTQAAGLDFVHVGGGKEKGFILEGHGSGAAFFDGDNDGDLDIFLTNQSGDSDAMWRNDITGFVDVAPELGMDETLRDLASGGVGCAVGDYDNDGLADL